MTNSPENHPYEHPVQQPGEVLPSGELKRMFTTPDDHVQLRQDLDAIAESERLAMTDGNKGPIGSVALGTEFMAKVAQDIANDNMIASGAFGALATEWALCVAEQPSLVLQNAATAGFSHHLRQGASPADFLRGDLGEAAQLDFLNGALMALELVAKTRLEGPNGNFNQ